MVQVDVESDKEIQPGIGSIFYDNLVPYMHNSLANLIDLIHYVTQAATMSFRFIHFFLLFLT